MSPAPYRIEDLAHHSGATVRTIRGYQDRGLLPKPERRGRANVYDGSHLARLRQISGLLERGYTLASIRELLTAWDSGIGLAGVLGLVTEVDRPWSDEAPGVVTRAELATVFARTPRDGGGMDEGAFAEAVELGVLVPLSDAPERYHVPSPQELAVAAELHAAGAPLGAVTRHLRELRSQIEHIASRFLDFTTEHVFARYLDHTPTEEEVAEATSLIRRLRPLAQQTVDAELARAMSVLATRHLQQQMASLSLPLPTTPPDPARTARTARTTVTAQPDPGSDDGSGSDHDPGSGSASGAGAEDTAPVRDVPLPRATVRAVSALVSEGAGKEPGELTNQVAAFITAATERELHARTMDRLMTGAHPVPAAPRTAVPRAGDAHPEA